MIKEYVECDSCGKANPLYTREGWYHIVSDTPILIGIWNESKTSNVMFNKHMHFCCESCFIEFIQQTLIQIQNQTKK